MNGLLVALMLAGGAAPPPPEPPPVTLQDLDRFPPASLTKLNSDFSYRHRMWLLSRQKFWLTIEERDYWQERYNDQDWRWDVWSDLAIAHDYVESGYTEGVLIKLRRIRRLLGDEAYNCGMMPPCCAIWLFERSDY